jgi:4-hydroxy-tetrahydrodipicolinate synthase
MKDINSTRLWTALITPMTNEGAVDFTTLEKLCREQNAAGNGILVLGSTAEALNLNQDEKKKIFEFVPTLNLDVPLMAGVGGINLEETTKDVNYLNSLKYDCYLLVTPLYAKPGEKGQTHWFHTLLETSTKPCMLYNVPGRTGCSLNIQTVSSLKDHPNFWAIKEASGSPIDFEKYVKASSPKKVYSGDDGMLPEYAPLDCKGLVSVASNCWPKQTNLYTNLTLSNELGEDHQWQKWSNDLFLASNPVPVKVLMAETGMINSPICRAPLNHNDMKDLDSLKESNTQVTHWYNQKTN